MRVPTWVVENAVLAAALALVLGGAGTSPQTVGWALVVLGAHTASSHGLRLRERDGRLPDWTAEGAKWVTALGVALQQGAPNRWLTLVGLGTSVYFVLWRVLYRRFWPAVM